MLLLLLWSEGEGRALPVAERHRARADRYIATVAIEAATFRVGRKWGGGVVVVALVLP